MAYKITQWISTSDLCEGHPILNSDYRGYVPMISLGIFKTREEVDAEISRVKALFYGYLDLKFQVEEIKN